MPKKQSKKQQQLRSNPGDILKEKANQLVKDEKYVDAIKNYTEAIQIDQNNAVYYNNRSLAYFLNYQYQESLQDANKSLEIDSRYTKAILRKAQAMRQLDQLEESIKFLEESLKIAEKEQIQPLINDFSNELKQIGQEEKNESQLYKWLQQNKGEIKNTRIQNFGENNRGVRITQDTRKDENLLYIPLESIITLELAKKESKYNQLIEDKKINLISETHNVLAIYLLEEKSKKQQSRWFDFINILPTAYPTNPVFYKEQDMTYLQGSPVTNLVLEKVGDLKKDYDSICQGISDFQKQFSFEDFCWGRVTVSSRQFGLDIKGQKTSALIPYADMMNHQDQKITDWNFDDEQNGFVVKSLVDMKRGDAVLYSYGNKSNARFLIGYGFTMKQNFDDELLVKVGLDEKDELLEQKQEFMKNKEMNFIGKIQQVYDRLGNIEFYGLLRFICLKDQQVVEKLKELHEKKSSEEGFDPRKTPPISIENEIDMWNKLNEICFNLYKSYPTSLEDDYKTLQDQSISENQRNCITVVSGEKEILIAMIQTSQKMLSLLKTNKRDVLKLMLTPDYAPYANYILKVLLSTLKLKDSDEQQKQEQQQEEQKQ